MQRRRDGEYRLREYDPATVHRLAVELLTAFAKDPGAAQIADLEEYLPDIKWLAPGDGERDDLVDAIYEACERAITTIPGNAGNVADRLLGIINTLAEHATDDTVRAELPDAINEALEGSSEVKAVTEARELARIMYRILEESPTSIGDYDERLDYDNLPDWIHDTPKAADQ